ncbi:hypothetical protein PspLS_08458 [Pyricularia sp. CBS 133598]|nr:hypothetical protein PspLS_08458 [Pyricularia sp. CBS 133598]
MHVQATFDPYHPRKQLHILPAPSRSSAPHSVTMLIPQASQPQEPELGNVQGPADWMNTSNPKLKGYTRKVGLDRTEVYFLDTKILEYSDVNARSRTMTIHKVTTIIGAPLKDYQVARLEYEYSSGGLPHTTLNSISYPVVFEDVTAHNIRTTLVTQRIKRVPAIFEPPHDNGWLLIRETPSVNLAHNISGQTVTTMKVEGELHPDEGIRGDIKLTVWFNE